MSEREHIIDRGLYLDSGGGCMCEVCGRQGLELKEPCEVSADDPYIGWAHEDCCCCAGIAWGGESPVECSHCNGTGSLWLHEASGVVAEYPGGRFVGKRERRPSERTGR